MIWYNTIYVTLHIMGMQYNVNDIKWYMLWYTIKHIASYMTHAMLWYIIHNTQFETMHDSIYTYEWIIWY